MKTDCVKHRVTLRGERWGMHVNRIMKHTLRKKNIIVKVDRYEQKWVLKWDKLKLLSVWGKKHEKDNVLNSIQYQWIDQKRNNRSQLQFSRDTVYKGFSTCLTWLQGELKSLNYEEKVSGDVEVLCNHGVFKWITYRKLRLLFSGTLLILTVSFSFFKASVSPVQLASLGKPSKTLVKNIIYI